MLSLPLSFLLCSPELLHSTTMSPCLLFVSYMSLPALFQLLFLAFLLFCLTYQVTHPCLPKLGHFLSKRFLRALQFSPSCLWLYFFCFFLFHHKNHFAYHHKVLLCDTLIYYYLKITHFLQVPPFAHYIIYLGLFPPVLYVNLRSSFFLK